MADKFPARIQNRWATYTRADYGEISNSLGNAVDRTVKAAGDGWTWGRMQSVGWRAGPVTVVPGHGVEALARLSAHLRADATRIMEELRQLREARRAIVGRLYATANAGASGQARSAPQPSVDQRGGHSRRR